MQDYMTAAVGARYVQLREIAGHRHSRRGGRVIDLSAIKPDAPEAAPEAAATVAPQPAAETAEELAFACTR